MPAFNLITPQQLDRLIGTPTAPQLIDCCINADFELDPRLLPTARRIAHDQLAHHAAELAGQKVVVICQKGKKISQGGAALLRSLGVEAEALEGGVHAWRDAGLPLIPAHTLPDRAQGGLWVTRHRPKIDRISCPWLVRRFVDPKARFMFVAPAEVHAVSQRFGATAFDVEGAPFSDTRNTCSFDAMLTTFQLDTQPLQELAKVIRAADLGTFDAAPEAAGLVAMSVGLSRMYKDDLAQMEAGIALYDALYRWARDGQAETHGHSA